MKYTPTKLFFLLMLLFTGAVQINAQVSCDYTLKMYDSYGDGWNGAQLTINVSAASSTNTYSLLNDGIQDLGDSLTVIIPVTDGEPIVLSYTPGFYEGEVSYYLYDSDGSLVYTAGPNPPQGIAFFSTIASCPSCPGVSVSNINVTNITASSAKVTWTNGGLPSATYIVEYGPSGFTPGTGLELTTANLTITLNGLNENVNYDVYLQRICEGGDASAKTGPKSFKTNFVVTPATCVYKIKLNSQFGFSPAEVDVDVNGTVTTFTTFNSTQIFDFNAYENYPFTVSYVPPGFTLTGLSYQVLDANNNVLFNAGPIPLPQAGVAYTDYACPTCAGPKNVKLADVRTSYAILDWQPSGGVGTYKVEYGPLGFTLGTGTVINTTDTTTFLTGLTELGTYDVYIELVCTNGDNSARIGPLSFTTLRANDVGIVGLSNPTTACGVGVEDVGLNMFNFGGVAQSLIPYMFSINGETQSVSVPIDGYYTGVIGNDSTITVYFDNMYDFSTPGDYTIQAWTELDDDSDNTNDTLTTVFTNIPILTTFPDQQNFDQWSGGWTLGEGSEFSTWERGVPNDLVINTATSGTNVWTTNLDGEYNLNEESYLLSPCLDFSQTTGTPRISFAINYNTYLGYDGAWLEGSKDGGATWSKLGAIGVGTNWYNTTSFFVQDSEFWSGNSNGWKTTQLALIGYGNQADCRLRFVFHSEGFEPFGGGSFDGVAIDNMVIYYPVPDDLAATNAVRTDVTNCGSETDKLKITINNFGTQTKTGFNVGYQVDDFPAVVENVGSLSIAANQSGTYTFATPFNSTGGAHTVIYWSELNNDQITINDSSNTVITTTQPTPLPVVADFEGNFALPVGWTGGYYVSFDGISNVAQGNLYSSNPSNEFLSPFVGPVNAGDSLTFDYRLINFGAGDAYIPGANDNIVLGVSTDCGSTYTTLYTINNATHEPSTDLATVKIDITDYAGQSVVFRWAATWGSGDYFIHFDNINIIGCPPNLGGQMNVAEATGANDTDGAITLIPSLGTAPYNYQWSDNSTNNTLENLGGGTYTVTITDAAGCSEVRTIEVGINTATTTPEGIFSKINLAPNPTSGNAILDVQFNQVTDVNVQILNLVGQIRYTTRSEAITQAQYALDLNGYAAGIYLVRISAGGKTELRKLVVTK